MQNQIQSYKRTYFPGDGFKITAPVGCSALLDISNGLLDLLVPATSGIDTYVFTFNMQWELADVSSPNDFTNLFLEYMLTTGVLKLMPCGNMGYSFGSATTNTPLAGALLRWAIDPTGTYFSSLNPTVQGATAIKELGSHKCQDLITSNRKVHRRGCRLSCAEPVFPFGYEATKNNWISTANGSPTATQVPHYGIVGVIEIMACNNPDTLHFPMKIDSLLYFKTRQVK